jgi:hypothetical protein
MMTTPQTEARNEISRQDRSAVTGSNRGTLDTIFRHPLAHNLEWRDVVALFEKLGEVEEKSNSEFVFQVLGQEHMMRKPHTKDLTTPQVMEVRHFLSRAGWSPDSEPRPSAPTLPAAPGLMIVLNHHGAKIYHIDVTHDDASRHEIRPYDPHHFLHHLTHKDQSREQGQRAPEEPQFYEQIARAVAAGGRIVVVGHGEGKSSAADRLIEYLRIKHNETYRRVVRELVADLSSVTPPQLLDIARRALQR